MDPIYAPQLLQPVTALVAKLNAATSGGQALTIDEILAIVPDLDAVPPDLLAAIQARGPIQFNAQKFSNTGAPIDADFQTNDGKQAHVSVPTAIGGKYSATASQFNLDFDSDNGHKFIEFQYAGYDPSLRGLSADLAQKLVIVKIKYWIGIDVKVFLYPKPQPAGMAPMALAAQVGSRPGVLAVSAAEAKASPKSATVA